MIPEIEELRKFLKAKISKALLTKLRDAVARVTTLLENFDPKPDDEDAEDEFTDAQSELESALDALESGFDDLENAEEKDEREDAVEEISSALEDFVTACDEIVRVGVDGRMDDAQILEDCKKKREEVLAAPEEKRMAILQAWLSGTRSVELREQKKNVFKSLGEDDREEVG